MTLLVWKKKIADDLPKIMKENKQMENLTPDLLSSIIDSMVTMTKNSLIKISTKITTILLKKITEQTHNELQNIVTIPRAYRLTGIDVDKKPMPYVQNLLNPVTSFYSAYAPFINQETWQEVWLKEILTNLIEKYIEMANQLLTTERKKEAIISRVNKTKGSVALTRASMSDTDKMTLQLILDIRHFLVLLSKFGINGDHFPPFQRLWALVSDSQHVCMREWLARCGRWVAGWRVEAGGEVMLSEMGI